MSEKITFSFPGGGNCLPPAAAPPPPPPRYVRPWCQIIEWSVNVLENGHLSVSQSLRCTVSCRYGTYRIHHVFADTGILGLNRNVSSGSGNRGRCVGMCALVASSPATGKRTTGLISDRRVIKGAPDKEVAEVTITAIRT